MINGVWKILNFTVFLCPHPFSVITLVSCSSSPLVPWHSRDRVRVEEKPAFWHFLELFFCDFNGSFLSLNSFGEKCDDVAEDLRRIFLLNCHGWVDDDLEEVFVNDVKNNYFNEVVRDFEFPGNFIEKAFFLLFFWPKLVISKPGRVLQSRGYREKYFNLIETGQFQENRENLEKQWTCRMKTVKIVPANFLLLFLVMKSSKCMKISIYVHNFYEFHFLICF